MDNTDFSMKVNNENYEEWYGSEDMHEGFSHQLNQITLHQATLLMMYRIVIIIL